MIRTITPIFSIIIALLAFFFYTKPMFAGIQLLEGETKQYEEATENAIKLNSELKSKLDKKRSYSSSDIERLNALVPTEINEINVLADLNEITRKHNMLLGNISVENSDGDRAGGGGGAVLESTGSKNVSYEDIAHTEITFSLIGTYEQFKAFLADIEQSLVLMEVTNIGFASGESDLQQYEVSVQLFALPPIE